MLAWLGSAIAWADLPEGYWEGGKEGWLWYEQPVPPPPPARRTPELSRLLPPPAIPRGEIDPNHPAVRAYLKTMPVRPELLPRLPSKWLTVLTDVKLEAALDHPSFGRLHDYILVHRETFRRSAQFTDLWRLVLYTNPELDHGSGRPPSQLGLQVTDLAERQHDRQELAAWRDHAGLFFFFASSCRFCQVFAPIVKTFADTHGWAVLAVSRDGQPLPEFPEAVPDTGMGQALSIRTVPVVYLAIPQERFLVPVAQGLVTLDELEQRILALLRRRDQLREPTGQPLRPEDFLPASVLQQASAPPAAPAPPSPAGKMPAPVTE